MSKSSWVVLVIAVTVTGIGSQKVGTAQVPSDSTPALSRSDKTDVASESEAPTTQLTRKEVLAIAEATAKAEGYELAKYNMTGCHYEFTKKDHTWTVFYELKPPTPPGGHFLVSIDDRTKKAIFHHGE